MNGEESNGVRDRWERDKGKTIDGMGEGRAKISATLTLVNWPTAACPFHRPHSETVQKNIYPTGPVFEVAE